MEYIRAPHARKWAAGLPPRRLEELARLLDGASRRRSSTHTHIMHPRATDSSTPRRQVTCASPTTDSAAQTAASCKSPRRAAPRRRRTLRLRASPASSPSGLARHQRRRMYLQPPSFSLSLCFSEAPATKDVIASFSLLSFYLSFYKAGSEKERSSAPRTRLPPP
jgi:hypothetical protein